jgi:dTDP-4-amino-4,6-dideoxygalactose transaminase
MIPCAHPLSNNVHRYQEILSSIEKVLFSGNYILGSQVTEFENLFSKYCGKNYGVGVNSGTDALILSLKSLGIGPGDEVITVAHTAIATVSAIIACGARPVLVDVEADYFSMVAANVEMAITPRTKALIPVHIYGQSADMKPLMDIADRYNLYLIEDCAQANGAEYGGAPVGSMGVCGCFSFYPTKNLGAVGDGGIVVTNDKLISSKVRALRQYGWDSQREASEPGLNTRLDEMQAAILNIKLKYLEKDNQKRITIAGMYDEYLTDTLVKSPAVRAGSKHVYHLYVVQCSNRKEKIKQLNANGIFPGIHYARPIHFHSGYRWLCKIPSMGLPVTESLSKSILSLPMYPELDTTKIQYIVDCLVD